MLSDAARDTGGILLLRIVGSALGFLSGILLARLLGAAGFGIFAYASAWIAVLLIPATLGFQQLLPREVAVYQSQLDWGKLRGLLSFSHRAVLGLSCSVSAIAAVTAWFVTGADTPTVTIITFWIALLLLPLNSLIQLRQAVMRGLGRVVLGLFPEAALGPALTLAAFATLYFFYPMPLSPVTAITILVVLAALTFLIGDILLKRTVPEPAMRHAPTLHGRHWISAALPMVMITGLEVINTQTDLIMLGAITGERSAGIYSAAVRGASLVVFMWGSVNMAIGPIIARMYHSGAHKELQTLIHKSALAIFFGAALICLCLYIFRVEFLALFGAEFVDGEMALRILLFGNIVNAMAGSVGLILKMTGYERDVLWTGLCAAGANIVLNALLIPPYGIEGAAAATTISMSLWPIAAGVMVYKRTAINPTIFRGIRPEKPRHDMER